MTNEEHIIIKNKFYHKCKCGKPADSIRCFGDTRQGIGKDVYYHSDGSVCVYENFKLRQYNKEETINKLLELFK